MTPRHPESSPFDQAQPDDRGEVRPGDHVLHAGQTVHFTEHSKPNRAPDTTAARAQREHGRLRQAFDKVAPPGSKRRTAIAGGAVVAGAAAGTVGGGAERIGYELGEVAFPGQQNIAAESSPFGVPGVSVKRAARGVAANRADYRHSVAAAEAGAPGTPSLDSLSTDSQPAPEIAGTEATPTRPVKPGGVATEHPTDTGGVDGDVH